MSDPRLLQLVEIWHQACTDFVTLVREIPPEQWELPTDLEGWSVKDNVAHTAHLEAVLAGAPEETIEVADAPHLKTFVNHYTEQGVLARRDRDMATLAGEIEQAVATRYAELLAAPLDDPSAAPPRTPGGAPWNYGTLLNNRPLDVWMHDQDVRRAIGRPGGYDCAVATHVLNLLGLGLPMVVGKRIAPPAGTTVRLTLPEAGLSWTAGVGDDGRAALVADVAEPTTAVTLSDEDFVVLAGGRRTPEVTRPVIEGDEEIGRRLLGSLVMTP
jgi:uncharacterized protein (TIGR03083 family)